MIWDYSSGFSWKILTVVGFAIIAVGLVAVFLIAQPQKEPNPISLSSAQSFTNGFVDDITNQRTSTSFDKLGPSDVDPGTWKSWVESFNSSGSTIDELLNEDFSDSPADAYLAKYTAVYKTSGIANLHLETAYANEQWQITYFGLQDA